MKLDSTAILKNIVHNLSIPSGRHLYAVLGNYQALEEFIQNTIRQSRLPDGSPFPDPVSVNKLFLSGFNEDDLGETINKESKRPKYTQSKLNRIFEDFLREQFNQTNFIILQHLELVFAYSLDLSKLRRWAANQNHILILLPGEIRNQQIYLFHNRHTGELLKFDNQLFSENNIWELDDE